LTLVFRLETALLQFHDDQPPVAVLGHFEFAENKSGLSDFSEARHVPVGVSNHPDLFNYKTFLLKLSSNICSVLVTSASLISKSPIRGLLPCGVVCIDVGNLEVRTLYL